MYTYTLRDIYEAIGKRRESEWHSNEELKKSILNSRNNPLLRRLWQQIEEEYGCIAQEEIPRLSFRQFIQYEDEGIRIAYEKTYFDRRKRLLVLACTAMVEPNHEAVDKLHEVLWDICNEYTWCLPAHVPYEKQGVMPRREIDLFAAETAHALAEISVWLGDRLHPGLVRQMRREVHSRVIEPMLQRSTRFHWETADHNWSAVCAGAAGMAALLLLQDTEALAAVVVRVIRSLECFLQGYGEDGGCAEGITYWTYGFGYFVYFAEMLAAETDGRLDLMNSEKVKRIASFPQKIHLSENTFVNYSDASERTVLHSGLISRLADRCGVTLSLLQAPSLHQDHCYRWAHTTRNLLWTLRTGSFGRIEAQDNSVSQVHYLPDLTWFTAKKRGNDAVLAFSAKGGHNAEPHNHNDIGHFILHVNGENVLADLGAGMYTKGYFGDQRYEVLNNASRGHSVPLINGKEQREGADSYAEVTHYVENRNEAIFALNMTKAYSDDALQAIMRTFHWSSTLVNNEKPLLRVEDTVYFRRPGMLTEVLVSRCRPELQEGRVIWRGEQGVVNMHYPSHRLSPALHEEIYLDHDGTQRMAYMVHLSLNEPAMEAFITLDFYADLVR